MRTRVRRGTKGEVVQARVTVATKTRLDQYAEAQDTTASDLLRKLIEEYIKVMDNKNLHRPVQMSYNDAAESAPIGSR